MRLRAVPATVSLLVALGLSAAPPQARAEAPTMDGVYQYADEDGDVGTWTIRTDCSTTCVARVMTGPGRGFDAQLVDGRYVNSRTVPEGLRCPTYQLGETLWDGGHHSVDVIQWWDPVTLTGEVDFLYHSAPCYNDDRHDTFTLTRVG